LRDCVDIAEYRPEDIHGPTPMADMGKAFVEYAQAQWSTFALDQQLLQLGYELGKYRDTGEDAWKGLTIREHTVPCPRYKPRSEARN
jgi:hypothetical protein